MKKYLLSVLIISQLSISLVQASQKVYIIHGFGGLGIEMEKIHRAIDNEGYTSEIYTYPSLVKDVDSVGRILFEKIQSSFNTDTSKESLLYGLEKLHKNEEVFKILEIVQDYESPDEVLHQKLFGAEKMCISFV